MVRIIVPLVLVFTLGIVVFPVADGLGPASDQTPLSEAVADEIKAVLAEYAISDSAVERWLQSPQGRANARHVATVLASPKPVWNRTLAAFFLEVVVASGGPLIITKLPPGVSAAIVPAMIARAESGSIGAGRTWVLGRPTAFGTNKDEDRFELLWHQTALAVLQGSQQWVLQQSYLDAINERIDEAVRRNVIDGGRIPLARGIAAAGRCCRDAPPPAMLAGVPVPTLDETIALFERAAESPDLAAEALMRAALLLHRERRDGDAIRYLDRAPKTDDPVVELVRQLSRARILDALDRPAESADAYRRAHALYPDSQIPAIGLAAALLRAGRADEAVRIAAEVRHLSDAGLDPLMGFDRADARFIDTWLREIRVLRH